MAIQKSFHLSICKNVLLMYICLSCNWLQLLIFWFCKYILYSLSLLNHIMCSGPNLSHEQYRSFKFFNLHFLPVLTSGIPLQEISRSPSAFTGRNFRNWLLELRNSHSLIKSSRSVLIDRLLEGYDSARHGTGVRMRVFVCDCWWCSG